MTDVRKDFAIKAEEFNKQALTWENKIDVLYTRADFDLKDGVYFADSLIENDKSLDKWQTGELHTIVGELYYDNNSIKSALQRFTKDEKLTFDSPRNKANKAGCYIKLGNESKAKLFLDQAAETNYDFHWYIGNLYEIQKQTKLAIESYDFLYKKDSAIYSYCNKRIQELKQPNPKLFTELLYKDRRQKTILLLQPADSTVTPTTIGGFKIEKQKK
ncbi:MAG TPA: hypothetical protein VF868_09175 [Bacteroidia bacterium]|jgi:tetratricopeptide (TPR) repeat protein